MKKAKFLVSHFDAGIEKYEAGEVYPLTDDTNLCIVRGAAVEVDVDDEAPAAEGETKAPEGETNSAAADTTTAAAETPAADAKPIAKAKK